MRLRTDSERRALALLCRHCGATPGVWCSTVWTHGPARRATALHQMRMDDAKADGRLPIDVPEVRA